MEEEEEKKKEKEMRRRRREGKIEASECGNNVGIKVGVEMAE